jgi:hypothetical protein
MGKNIKRTVQGSVVSGLCNIGHLTSEETLVLHRNIYNFWFSWLNGKNVKQTGEDGPILNFIVIIIIIIIMFMKD